MKQLITLLTLIGVIGIGCMSARAAEEPQTITFELLAKTTYGENPPPVFPTELRSLEGKHVRISGFMVPYNDTETFVQLVLVNTPGGCFFCSPPLPNTLIFVRRPATDPSLAYTDNPITFDGVLHLWHVEMKEDDNARGFFFTLDDARVIPQDHLFSKWLIWIKNYIQKHTVALTEVRNERKRG